MTLATEIASHLLDIKAVYLQPDNPFTWASGIQSPIYTDNRVTLSYPDTRTLIEDGFVQKIKEEFPDVEVIAGTATAGIPHGAIIADRMNLPFAYIRSKPKDHGAGNQVEGRIFKGQKMVVIEDLISTGGSVLDAVAAAEREGADVLGDAMDAGDVGGDLRAHHPCAEDRRFLDYPFHAWNLLNLLHPASCSRMAFLLSLPTLVRGSASTNCTCSSTPK